MRELEERVALVAGASRGIGQGAAIELGAAGAFVYLLGRTAGVAGDGRNDTLAHTLHTIETQGGSGRAIACDCADPDQLAAAIAEIEERHGRLDIVVNSVFSTPTFPEMIGKRIWETPNSLWHTVVEVPGRAAYFTTALAAPLMIRSATREAPGLIVNISGRGALRYRYNTAYGVGKAAIARLTHDTSLELAPHHVAVLTVWPNGYSTDPSKPETPRYSGRAIVAIAADPDVMERSGRNFWSAEVAAEYGFTDEFGHSHEVSTLTDQYSLEHDELD
ncbi:MAG: SDR family NAD(P)-dependent oxidoreductase [Novosphingobium sp.]|nr:SDR family NAD(P)-dependent oxidoreductase [Novosphingobium sp.]